VTAAHSAYEAYALRFASTQMQKRGRYHRYDSYGEPDTTVTMDFFFWLIRNEQRTVLVDCGFHDERSRALGYRHDRHPLALLATMGVRAEDVDHVVLSHMHFDHIGNVDLFPNATFSIARAEFEFWTGPFSDRAHLKFASDPVEIAAVADLNAAGRLHLVEGPEELFPGITVTPVRGHTAGHLITEVTTRTGHVVVASDVIHFYEEMDLDRPFWLFCDLEGMYRGYQLLRDLEARPNTSVVAGHDPAVMTRFAVVQQDCVDLTTRVSS
jgi:glyoxylase-like metal-dependent hydrolase (beta-lactamase superfamily II)